MATTDIYYNRDYSNTTFARILNQFKLLAVYFDVLVYSHYITLCRQLWPPSVARSDSPTLGWTNTYITYAFRIGMPVAVKRFRWIKRKRRSRVPVVNCARVRYTIDYTNVYTIYYYTCILEVEVTANATTTILYRMGLNLSADRDK